MGMSLMNLFAGAQNFQVFVQTAFLSSDLRFELLALVAAVNLAVPIVLSRRITQPKSQLKIKTV
jgi:drug/metabolite transporter (DMT)-like permease